MKPQKDDTWNHKRMRWSLGKHNLPALHTSWYEDAPNKPLALVDLAESRQLGLPVACCIGDDAHWTLLGSKGIGGWSNNQLTITLLVNVRDMTSPTPKGWSGDHVFEIRDVAGTKHTFWFPTAHELYAFWSTILRFTRHK